MIDVAKSLAKARSLLSVPGHRPDRFVKAATSGADAFMLDLEDAVGPNLKSEARANVAEWLASAGTGIVRINGDDTLWHEDDIAMLSGRQCAVMVPKASRPEQLEAVLQSLAPGSCVVPALETATGVLAAREICSVPGVVRAVLGNVDLANELGIDHADRLALAHVRSSIVLASAASGVAPPLDGLTTAIANEERLVADVEHAAAFGFTGKACIHPCQISIVNAAFTPSDEDIRWAQDVVAAAGDGSVAVLDGQVIGTPVIERARNLVSRKSMS